MYVRVCRFILSLCVCVCVLYIYAGRIYHFVDGHHVSRLFRNERI